MVTNNVVVKGLREKVIAVNDPNVEGFEGVVDDFVDSVAAFKAIDSFRKITDLKRQVKFLLIDKQKGKKRLERKVEYVADYTYLENGELVVEDVNSDFTRKLPLYIVKRKMMLYFHNKEITEI